MLGFTQAEWLLLRARAAGGTILGRAGLALGVAPQGSRRLTVSTRR